MEEGKHGKTAFETSRGKEAKVMGGVEFGEKLLWMKRQKDNQKMGKIEARWEYGVFVGVRRRSGELWIATDVCAGFALDLTTGRDVSLTSNRGTTEKLLRETRPML